MFLSLGNNWHQALVCFVTPRKQALKGTLKCFRDVSGNTARNVALEGLQSPLIMKIGY